MTTRHKDNPPAGIKTGTCYFPTWAHAMRYYEPYEGENTKLAVNRKLEAGEIFLGRTPPHKLGDRLTVEDNRYHIEEGAGTDDAQPGTIADAVREILAREARVAVFALVEPDGVTVRNVLRFGLGNVEGKPCVRWCGLDGQPNGDGSSSVVATWYRDCMEIGRIVEAIEYNCLGLTPVRLHARAERAKP